MFDPAQLKTFIFACAGAALLYAILAGRSILAQSTGTDRMIQIAAAIQEGAKAYLNRQYQTIAFVGVIICGLLSWRLGINVGLGFLIGAVLSGLAGYIGMFISVRANVRTSQAARNSMAKALAVAFKSGAVTGMMVVGLALLGVAGYFYYLQSKDLPVRQVVEALVALSFGASLISIFARLGGGIFTKGADVGADLVGKVEAGIPEDDPRNPAVIADNVGDNVGDCAGMAADLFETYVVTIVATMLLSALYFAGGVQQLMLTYPLAIGAICILASIAGTFFVRLGSDGKIMRALYKGLFASAILSAVGVWYVTNSMLGMETPFTAGDRIFTGKEIYWCTLTGLGVTGLLVWITEYYTSTSFRPVRSVAKLRKQATART